MTVASFQLTRHWEDYSYCIIMLGWRCQWLEQSKTFNHKITSNVSNSIKTKQGLSLQCVSKSQTCLLHGFISAEFAQRTEDIYLQIIFIKHSSWGCFYVEVFKKNTSWTRNLCGYIGRMFFIHLLCRMLQHLNELQSGKLRCLTLIFLPLCYTYYNAERPTADLILFYVARDDHVCNQ